MSSKAALEAELVRDVKAYAAARGGAMYAPICHPAFDDVPYHHGPERFDIIAPHIPPDARTALDIGSHWGYFAHRLEDLGLRVTAAEMSPSYLPFLIRIKELCDKCFEVFPHSIFELESFRFDVVLGLNIFHHFIKTERVYRQFVDLLHQLDCQVLFYQAHNPEEGQMRDAFRNFSPENFVAFLLEETSLSHSERIGVTGRRPVFALFR